MKPFIVIVPGHGHRTNGLKWDPGTCSGTFQEADMVRIVARLLSAQLTKDGRAHVVSDPQGLADGYPHELRSYSRRCHYGLATAKNQRYTSAIVLHLHFNAGGGRYGLVVTDARAATEQKAAAPLVEALRRWGGAALSEVKNATDTDFPRARGLHDATWEHSGHMNMQISSFVIEPAFVDQPQHAGLLGDSGLEQLARWIAAGLA